MTNKEKELLEILSTVQATLIHRATANDIYKEEDLDDDQLLEEVDKCIDILENAVKSNESLQESSMTDKKILEEYKQAVKEGGSFGYEEGFNCPPFYEYNACEGCPASNSCIFLSASKNNDVYRANYKKWYDRNQKEIEKI